MSVYSIANNAKLASVVPINRVMLLKLNSQSSLFIMGNANARCNPANASDGQISTRLQAFVEMLGDQ